MTRPAENLLRIVMADDDPDDRLLARDAFSECTRATCVGFVDDGEALLLFLETLDPLPRLILLDWNMPRKNGEETLRALKGHPHFAPIPVVILTTSTDPVDVEEAYRLGAAGFITKPVTFEGLLQFVHEMVTRYAPEALS